MQLPSVLTQIKANNALFMLFALHLSCTMWDLTCKRRAAHYPPPEHPLPANDSDYYCVSQYENRFFSWRMKTHHALFIWFASFCTKLFSFKMYHFHPMQYNNSPESMTISRNYRASEGLMHRLLYPLEYHLRDGQWYHPEH